MTSFIAANLPSEDEEDQDYAPSLKELQEAGEASKKKSNKSTNRRTRGIADFDRDEEEQEAEREDAMQQKKLEKQKAKAEGLWAELQQKVSRKKSQATKMDMLDIHALSQSSFAKKKQKKRHEEVRSPFVGSTSRFENIFRIIGVPLWFTGLDETTRHNLKEAEKGERD
jgi:hypothetical protein